MQLLICESVRTSMSRQELMTACAAAWRTSGRAVPCATELTSLTGEGAARSVHFSMRMATSCFPSSVAAAEPSAAPASSEFLRDPSRVDGAEEPEASASSSAAAGPDWVLRCDKSKLLLSSLLGDARTTAGEGCGRDGAAAAAGCGRFIASMRSRIRLASLISGSRLSRQHGHVA